jgi:hypothetical protein
MEGDLPIFAARVIHIQNPLMMALTTGAARAGDAGRMEGAAFEQEAAKVLSRAGNRWRSFWILGSPGFRLQKKLRQSQYIC